MLEFKKSAVDELSFDEKVLLATQTINWFAVRTEKIYQQLKQIAEKVPDKIQSKSAKDWERHRSIMLHNIIKVCEDWGNFIDGRDALDEHDTVVTEIAFDLLYERYEPELLNSEQNAQGCDTTGDDSSTGDDKQK